MANPCPRLRYTTSIFGQLESPVVCRVQPGKKCWKRSGSWACGSARPLTRLRAQAARKTPADSRSTAIRLPLGNLGELTRKSSFRGFCRTSLLRSSSQWSAPRGRRKSGKWLAAFEAQADVARTLAARRLMTQSGSWLRGGCLFCGGRAAAIRTCAYGIGSEVRLISDRYIWSKQ
jgi:hypothetical protein